MLHFLSTLILLVPLVHVKVVGHLCHFHLSWQTQCCSGLSIGLVRRE
jgi:hypothetical protein